jgi:hypothetical protein
VIPPLGFLLLPWHPHDLPRAPLAEKWPPEAEVRAYLLALAERAARGELEADRKSVV